MIDTLSLTMAEAGFVLGRSPKAINKAIDDGIIEVRGKADGETAQRVLGAGELRYLGLAEEFGSDLTRVGQKRLYAAIRLLPADKHILQWGKVTFDFEQLDAALVTRLRELERLREAVELRDGVAFIRGTNVPVHLVAALSRGQTTDEVIEDYPRLTREQIATASDYATAFPKLGRPYPTRSLKRMIADAAEAGVFDEEPHAGGVEPQLVRWPPICSTKTCCVR